MTRQEAEKLYERHGLTYHPLERLEVKKWWNAFNASNGRAGQPDNLIVDFIGARVKQLAANATRNQIVAERRGEESPLDELATGDDDGISLGF